MDWLIPVGIAAVVFLIGFVLDRACKNAVNHHEQLTPAEDAPAFKDETSELPAICSTTQSGATIALGRTGGMAHIPPACIDKMHQRACPICGHPKGREGCGAVMSTAGAGKLYCTCSYASFHARRRRPASTATSKTKSKAKPKKKAASKRRARK